jgi:hypothetical protein
MGKFNKLQSVATPTAESSEGPVTTVGAPKRASAPAGTKGLIVRLPVSDWATLKHIQAETGLSAQQQIEQALVFWFSQHDKGEPQAVRDRRAAKERS